MGYKRNIKESTRRMLYARSGNMCAMYGCHNVLINENTSNISEICHIEAVNDDGARYNGSLTDEEVNSYDNLVLLCPRCHAIVDNKANESIYTVEYLKEMKRIHEQQIYDALMAKTVISPPVHVETYNVDRIVTCFNTVYEKDIDASYVRKVIKRIYSLNIAIRSVVYGLIVQCVDNRSEYIDAQRLHASINLDIYRYAEIFMLLANEKMIEETKYDNAMAGYEDENGDFHFVQNDYLFRTTQGTWRLKKRGKIFGVIYQLLSGADDFYDFIVNNNLEILRKIK
jgi:hypothetical protein|nr:MAG TPA: AcrIIC3 protein [Caudoviricetes sp.]